MCSGRAATSSAALVVVYVRFSTGVSGVKYSTCIHYMDHRMQTGFISLVNERRETAVGDFAVSLRLSPDPSSRAIRLLRALAL